MPPLDRWPRLVAWLLSRVLPPAAASDIVGDLLEQYAASGRRRPLWLAGQALAVAWGMNRPRGGERRPLSVAAEVWLGDLRYAARSLARSRGFSAVAVLSVSLGLGLTTAVFSIVDGVLLRPLPYGEPDRIVRIRQVQPAPPPHGDTVPRTLLRRLEEGASSLSALAPYATADARIFTGRENVVAPQIEVGERFFDIMRTAPARGRLLGRADGEPGAPMVALLSHAFWDVEFARDPSIVGRQVLVDERPVEVVGVLPPSFTFPSTDAALYVPGRWRFPEAEPGVGRAFFGPAIEVVGRLRSDAGTGQAERELAAVAPRAPGARGAAVTTVFAVTRLQDDLAKTLRPALLVMVASVACVLAIVCVNLTNLLLARATVRQREIAVRAALGASRWRMVRPLALEGMLLSLAGGGGGALLAWVLIGSVPLAGSIDPLLASQIRVDGRVLAFVMAASTAIGVAVAILPAWQAPAGAGTAVIAGGHVHVLPGATVRAESARSTLVVLQVALAIVLAVGAALLSRSLVRLLAVDLGLEPAGVLTLQVRLPPRGGLVHDWRARFYEDLMARLSAHPSVRATGFTTSLPTYQLPSLTSVRIDAAATADGAALRSHREVVSPDYFAAIRMRVVAGRGFTTLDRAGAEKVVVINESFVTAFLPGLEPIDRRVMVFGDWYRIVGVVRSKRNAGLRGEVRPEVFVPLAQSPPDVASGSGVGLALRATGDPRQLLPFVRDVLRELQPLAALENEGMLEERLWASTAQPRFYTSVIGVFAALSLVTAMVGLFGTLSYLVERRRVEIGVRRALGATPADIFGLVIGRGLRLVALAAPLGIAGAFAGAGLLRNLLFGIEPLDPVAFLLVLLVVPAVALIACGWPAHRAARIEPAVALRQD